MSALLPLCCFALLLFVCFLRGKSLAEKNENIFEKEKEQKAEEVSEQRCGFSFTLYGEGAFCVCESHTGVLICVSGGACFYSFILLFILFLISTNPVLCVMSPEGPRKVLRL